MKRGSLRVLLTGAFFIVLTASAVGQQATPSERAALNAYRQGEFSRAVKLYTKALAETGDAHHRAQLHVRIGWTLFALGRESEVPTHLRAALLEDPNLELVPDYYTKEFLELFNRVKKEGARLETASGTPAPDLEATIDSVKQRLDSDTDLEGALADVKVLIKAYPNDGRLLPLKLSLLEKLGRAEDAARLRQSLVAATGGAASPGGTQALSALSAPELVLRANRFLDQGDMDTALDLLRRAVDKQPGNVAALELLAEAARRAGRWQEAEFALKSALSYQKENLELQLRLGEIYLAMGQLSSARDVFQQLTEKHPHSDRAWAALGLLDARLAKYDRATGELDRALKENPLLPETQLAYGELLLIKGHPQKALAALQSAANLLQDDPQLEARTGQALLALDRSGPALPHLRAAVQGKFDPPDVVSALVLAELRQGLEAEARRTLESSGLKADHGVNLLKGLLSLAKNDLSSALTLFRAQARLEPNSAPVLNLIGVVLYRQHDFSDSIPVFERARELAGRDPVIERNLNQARAAAAADELRAQALSVPPPA